MLTHFTLPEGFPAFPEATSWSLQPASPVATPFLRGRCPGMADVVFLALDAAQAQACAAAGILPQAAEGTPEGATWLLSCVNFGRRRDCNTLSPILMLADGTASTRRLGRAAEFERGPGAMRVPHSDVWQALGLTA